MIIYMCGISPRERQTSTELQRRTGVCWERNEKVQTAMTCKVDADWVKTCTIW